CPCCLVRAGASVHPRAARGRLLDLLPEPLEIAVLDRTHDIDDVDLSRAQPFDHVEVAALEQRPDRGLAPAPFRLARRAAGDAEPAAAEALVADLNHVGACTTRHQLALAITVRALRNRSSASRLMRYSLVLPVPMLIT